MKRARSVIHSLAHHGISALSWLHPRLGEECHFQKLKSIEYDLLNGKFLSEEFSASKETKMAFEALKETFIKITNLEDIQISNVLGVTVIFGFETGKWPSFCYVSLRIDEGKEINVKVDGFGRKYGPLSKYGAIYS